MTSPGAGDPGDHGTEVVPRATRDRLPFILTGVFVVAAGILIGVGVVSLPAPDFATERKPESGSALYFNNPEDLPRSYRPGERVTFGWSLQNDTGQQRSYAYEVELHYDGESRTVERAQLSVEPGAMVSRVSSVTFPPQAPRSVVVIRTADQKYRISFHSSRAPADERP